MQKVIIIIFFTLFLSSCDQNPDQKLSTNSLAPSITPPSDQIINQKLIPNDTLCSQISQDFVSQVTGVAIARADSKTDFSITACNFYIANENNSPYIAVILNKNLSVEIQKQFAQKNKLIFKTDPSISGNHQVVWSKDTSQIAYIDLILDDNNFIRIDKNVNRAIDDSGLLKLAGAISAKL